jgi:hypothetical protein
MTARHDILLPAACRMATFAVGARMRGRPARSTG